jgi:glycosyltransferase involved in cell wall biosynthesis
MNSSARKKILYIHHAGGLGGAPKSLFFLINDLDKTIYEPVVLVIENGPVMKFFSTTGARVILDEKLYPFHGTTVSGMSFNRFIKNWIGFILTYIRFPGVLRKINPEIIHLNTTCLFAFAMVAKKIMPSIKIISHIREPILDSWHGDILRFFNNRYVDEFIAISKYDAQKMSQSRPINIVYNFVDTDLYTPKKNLKRNLRTNYRMNANAVTFICFSRIAESNGTLDLIHTASEVTKSYKNFYFLILGYDTKNRTAYNQKVRELAFKNKNIILIKMRPDVKEIVSQVDVIISPYLVPHFSRPVIEGAALGKPAIVSNVGSQNELVINNQTGILYDLNNRTDLINAIKLLGTNGDLRKKMGENARDFALKMFDLKENVKKISKIYEDVSL